METLSVLVLLALAAIVGLGLLVLLGRVDNPEWLEREDPQDQLDPRERKARQALKARLDHLVELEEAEIQDRTAQVTPAQEETPAKGTAKEGGTSDGN